VQSSASGIALPEISLEAMVRLVASGEGGLNALSLFEAGLGAGENGDGGVLGVNGVGTTGALAVGTNELLNRLSKFRELVVTSDNKVEYHDTINIQGGLAIGFGSPTSLTPDPPPSSMSSAPPEATTTGGSGSGGFNDPNSTLDKRWVGGVAVEW